MPSTQSPDNMNESEHFGLDMEIFNQLPQGVMCSFWFEHSNDLVVVFDLAGQIMMLNRACASFLGGEVEEFIGVSVEDVLDDQFSPGRRNELMKVIETGRGFQHQRPITIKGEEYWFKSIVEPVKR